MPICCFWLEFANLCEWGLRRYTSFDKDVECTNGFHFHDGTVILGQHFAREIVDEGPSHLGEVHLCVDERIEKISWPPHDDPRWPRKCKRCAYQFTEDDQYQEWTSMLYRRSDNGELITLRESSPSAMWDAVWYPWKGPDGRSVVVKLPNGHEWSIDGRATNCTMPQDNEHHCWVRHGTPPKLTVDKNGRTCQAGAGSVQGGDYHGFLRDGCFT